MEVKIVNNDQELADAFEVRKTVFIHEQNVPEEEEIDQFESDSVHFVLYDDNRKAAGAGRFRVLDGIGKVERICVLKENRKTGAGVAVMNKIEEYAKSQGISTLKLNAQTHAIPFYSRLGYESVSEEFMDAGIPHKTMKKFI
ncbi:GNAT family N-acetyltransferase [Mesobacillus jeotgali]|uniref:GNAT family N-acetyltransferase n=1 Tax=Mesobacillus jeotgali TaxID=129985 RepID=UPI000C8326ED|nr:GNAT family N-acetyltransferase [Mesobacillus jeotgali]